MAIKVSLTVKDGDDKDATIEFVQGGVTIGRRRGEFLLTDKKISSEHCRISIEDDKVYLEDLGSTNGTFLAGAKIEQKTQLENLDEIIVGLSRITVAILEQVAKSNQTKTKTVNASDPMASAKNTKKNEEPVEDDSSISFIDDSGEVDEIDMNDILSDVEFKEKSKSKSTVIVPEAAPEPSHSGRSKKTTEDLEMEFGLPQTEQTASATESLPPENAVYRETGIQRIDSLIKDEMNTFSKWDDPAAGDGSKGAAMGAIPKVKVRLKIKKSPDGQFEFECTKPVSTIGRKDVDIRLNDLDCSRKHAQIEIIGARQVFVKDLASTNGTYVNGKKVTQQELNSGDLVQVGQTLFEVQIEG